MADIPVPPETGTAECDAELRLHAFADGSEAFLTCDLKMAEHPSLNHHDPVYETWWRECDQSCGHPHAAKPVVHAYPVPDIDSPMPCCGRTRHQISPEDRIGLVATAVTCRG